MNGFFRSNSIARGEQGRGKGGALVERFLGLGFFVHDADWGTEVLNEHGGSGAGMMQAYRKCDYNICMGRDTKLQLANGDGLNVY